MTAVVHLFPVPERGLCAAVQPELAHGGLQPGLHAIRLDAEVSGDGLIRSAVRSEAADNLELSRAERGAVALIIAFACLGSVAIGFLIGRLVG
jgi:hypothetical protein